MAKYNGHKNWNYWNVSLWIGNDEGLYNLARTCVRHNDTRRQAAEAFISDLVECGYKHRARNGAVATPDGAPFTVSAVIAAMREM